MCCLFAICLSPWGCEYARQFFFRACNAWGILCFWVSSRWSSFRTTLCISLANLFRSMCLRSAVPGQGHVSHGIDFIPHLSHASARRITRTVSRCIQCLPRRQGSWAALRNRSIRPCQDAGCSSRRSENSKVKRKAGGPSLMIG